MAACVRIDARGLTIAQPTALADLAGALVRADLTERTHERAGDPATAAGQPRGVQPYIRRWQALWATAGRRVLLGEVLAEPDADPDDAPSGAQLRPHLRLHQHWEAHFAFKPVDKRLAQALSRRFGAWQVEVGPLRTATHVQACLRRCNRTAPGPDGVPHLAWRPAGRIGSHVLARALHALLVGGRPSPTLNSVYLVCIAKGIRPEEGAVVARGVSDPPTRAEKTRMSS